MSWSSETLFYGTFVKAIPLFIAADAWTRVKPAFLALDIISSRRSKGTLSFENGAADESSLAKLPVEVMDGIKREVADLEMKEAQRRIGGRYACWGMVEEGEDYTPCSFPAFTHWKCVNKFAQAGGMTELAEQYEKPILNLLRDFKLCRPSIFLIGTDNFLASDLAALVPLALPLHSSTSSAFPSAFTRPEEDEYADLNGFAKLDPSALVLPPDADRRFQRFTSLFAFDTFDPAASTLVSRLFSDDTVGPRPWSMKTKSEDDKAEQKKYKEKGYANNEPKMHKDLTLAWNVWAFCPPSGPY